MRRGPPVACSTRRSLPEIAGDAARFFDPTDLRAIAAATADLLDEPALRRDAVARGRKQVTRFSWRALCPWHPGRLPRRPWMDGAPRARVLWLTPEPPRPTGGTGGQTRQFHLLRRLVERGDDLTVVAPVHPTDREGTEGSASRGIVLRALHRPRSLVRARCCARSAAGLSSVPAAGRRPVTAWQADVFWTR